MAFIKRLFQVLLCAAVLLPLVPAPAAQAQQGPQDIGNSDIVLVIDHSGSMEENDPNYMRLAAAKLFIDLADPGDRIGIVVMSGKSATRWLTKRGMVRVKGHAEELKQLVDGIRREPMGDYTYMGSALKRSYDLLNSTMGSAQQRQFVVMLSDGLPTGDGQEALVQDVAARFQQRRYWKVFSIALAFKDQAGFDYLQQAVAAPTGAEVVKAANADELLDKYLDIYARAGDDRFIDRVTVQPNTLAALAALQDDQQPSQISVVLLRAAVQRRINSLLAPNSLDLVQPYYQNTIYHTEEPEYELYKVPAKSQIGLVGNWKINILQQDQEPVQVAILSRSRLHIRMPSPVSLNEKDDGSPRYWPVGRKILLVTGAQTEDSGMAWVPGMAPMVRSVAPVESKWNTLTDDGRAYDAKANDGHFTGLLPPFASEGDYTLQVEVPRLEQQAVHIRRDYLIRVAALPTMTLTLPASATTLPQDTAFTGFIDLPGRADFQIERVTFPFAFVQRPDGTLDPLTMQPDADRFRFAYTPNFSGPYRISLAAEVHGRGPMGDVRYVDYTESTISVPEAAPVVALAVLPKLKAAFAEGKQLLYDSKEGVLKVTLLVQSQAAQRETVHVAVEGVPGSSVFPEELPVEPNQTVRRVILVRFPADAPPKEGEVALKFTSPEQRVIVQGSTITVPFEAQRSNLLLTVLVAAGVVAGVGFLYYSYWRRRRRRAAAPIALRRVS